MDNESVHVIPDVPESSSNYSITTLLNYCKNKILNPYLRLLSFMSLRPLFSTQEYSCPLEALNFIYVLILIVFMLAGYVLQYMSCFRRDRGFSYLMLNANKPDPFLSEREQKDIQEQICYGSTAFSFIIPSALHFVAYLHAIFIFKSTDDDQLPVLMERVFLASSSLSNGFVIQKKVVRLLWIFVLASVIWMGLSITSVSFLLAEGTIDFKWIPHRFKCYHPCLKSLLVASILWHDCLQATIISNYCLQAQLLTSYLQFLRERLLQYSTEPIKWMRDIEEFKKLLAYLNRDVAPSTCVFTLVNMSIAISGLLWLLNYDTVDQRTQPIVGISILNIILWISIATVPFLQAARLTSACRMISEVGHEVSIRPFVHIGTPRCELDSVLLYTSSLKLGAKLYNVTISWTYLCFFITTASVCILVLGMCHYLS